MPNPISLTHCTRQLQSSLASHAVSSAQQFSFVHTAHASSSGAISHIAVPVVPLSEPLPPLLESAPPLESVVSLVVIVDDAVVESVVDAVVVALDSMAVEAATCLT